MPSKLWVFRDINPAQREALSQALSISSATAALLLARGVTTLEEATAWMSPIRFHDPFLIPDMDQAVDRLHRAVTHRERVCFYGDYDVDGMCATSIYLSFFDGLGADLRPYVPHRIREGYGLNEKAIRTLAADGVTLLVTSDCGTTSHREIATANALGMDVLVTDHHQTDDRMPAALAVMNPHRADARYPFRGLCSGGLAYKVVSAYHTRHGAGSVAPDSLLDLVALATIADVVPLQDENRAFVRVGLDQITRGARCGLRALKQVAGIARPCSADTVAFKLGPRLNAAGRLDEAILGVRLLTTESEREAKQLAERLEQLNRTRQQIEADIMSEAVGQIGEGEQSGALVLASRRWHLGVVGIVAARLVERYQRPAIVLAINEQGLAKGSARTIPGFDLYQALVSCRDLLVAFGGHPSAAGLTIEEDRLPEFSGRFGILASSWAAESQTTPRLHLDSELTLHDVNHRLLQEIGALHPFGVGNPEPMFAGKRLEIMNARVVGEKHLKLTLRQGRSLPVDSIGFGMKSLEDFGISLGTPVDVAFTPELNHWNGCDRIQLRIRDLRPAAGE